MKTNYKILAIALGLVAMTSCDKHDILGEIVDPGQKVPTVYWELGTTTCPAGESFDFQGKYTVDYEGATPDHSEVWYRVNRAETAIASVALAGSSFNYSKTYAATDTMRSFTSIAQYPHEMAQWDGHEFVLQASVPVSRTLKPVTWKDASEFSEKNFNAYYPKGFDKEFCDEVVDLLTKDSTYYNAMRAVYINYPFTNEQFAEVNQKYGVELPASFDNADPDKASSDKSDAWFYTTNPDPKAVTGYYYITVDGELTAYHEVGKDDVTVDDNGFILYEGHRCYPVYKAAPWVFCRYDDETGAILSTVRPAYMVAFKDLFQQISFPEWIYNSAEKVYRVDFSRKYSLTAQFRVYDSNGEEGIAYDNKEVEIN